MPPILTQREFVRVAVQSAFGTKATNASLWTTIPIEPGSFTDAAGPEQLLDEGRRGVDAKDFGAYEGVAMADINFTANLRVREPGGDTRSDFGVLMANLLGVPTAYPRVLKPATGNVAKVAGHVLRLGNNALYLTLEHIIPAASGNAALYHRYQDCMVVEMGISSNAGEGLATYTAKLIGQDREIVSAAAPAVGTLLGAPFEGWRMAMDGDYTTLNTRLMSAEWTLTRESSAFYSAQAQQSYADVHRGALEVTAELTFDFNSAGVLTPYTGKTQGDLLTRWFTDSTLGDIAATSRRITIGNTLFDIGDTPPPINMSEVNARVAFGARGLVDSKALTAAAEAKFLGSASTFPNIPASPTPVIVVIWEGITAATVADLDRYTDAT